MLFAEVIVDINHHQVDKIFDYQIPIELRDQLVAGQRVLVPFNNRQIIGFVVGIKNNSSVNNIKSIIEILDSEPVIAADLLELTKWIANKYFCQQVQVLKSVLPEKIKKFKNNSAKYYILASDKVAVDEALQKTRGRAPLQYAVLKFLLAQDRPVEQAELKSALGQVAAPLKALLAKGLIFCEQGVANKDPYYDTQYSSSVKLVPNSEQKIAIDNIISGISQEQFSSWLLYGITGSGKTEVYLQAIAEAIRVNKDAIVLVPEISLTPQTVTRFKERFGNLVAVFHSMLTPSEKLDQWWKIKTGQVKVVVGARSAIFAPFSNLGLIIIDEEHETSYKQEETPRYHVKDIALKRAELTGSVVVFGSATPSMETFYEAKQNGHRLLKLTERPKGNNLPKVEIIDLREELREGNRSIFSRVLQEKILETIGRREQVILFLNRRGHSTFVNCRECGYVASCPNCAVSLTLHSVNMTLKCHYCNYTREVPVKCPECGSSQIRHFGIGTQKVEEEVKKVFSQARILRMDNDTTRGKGSHQKIIDLFQHGRADILIGTQMIAKGLDFPKVSLVGILAADLSLNLPDFRACERTFQLATQVAGRAGRDAFPGEVIIQTYTPNNYAIKCAQTHDYENFFQLELEQRRKLSYPPFTTLVRILAVGSNERTVELHIMQIGTKIKNYIVKEQIEGLEVIGPQPAPISKLHNQYRWHIILKGIPDDVFPYIKQITDYYYTQQEKVKIVVDVNPLQII